MRQLLLPADHLATAETEGAAEAAGVAEAEAVTAGAAVSAATTEGTVETAAEATGAPPPVPASSFFTAECEPQPTNEITNNPKIRRFIFFSKFTFVLKVA